MRSKFSWISRKLSSASFNLRSHSSAVRFNGTYSSFKKNISLCIPITLNISSTEIRELVKKKKQIYPLVPRIVSQCIKRFGLYE